MTKRSRKRLALASGLLLVAALCLPALGLAAPPTGQLVEIENSGSKMYFYPAVEFDRMVLTVTGPCGYEHREVSTGREMVFALDDTTIDGVYRFYVTREEKVPSQITALLKQARKNDDPKVAKALCREGLLPAPPQSQTSGFLVDRGRIIYDPTAVEDRGPSAGVASVSSAAGGGNGDIQVVSAADFVINDDLIVDGSACIGFDCVNGEVFGFDTIRLKENNLRIKFDDTSTAASFPRNDWQLTANDSANGGASKFSIDDISGGRTPFTVEANARSHSLYVDDGGRIGSRTSTPSVEIHTIDGDTPTLRLQQDGSSGFAPQTWDVAGNETNFFVRDVTNGSALPFRIRPGAPTSSIFIDVDGDVGLGTASPGADASLHVVANTGTANDVVLMQNDGPTRFALNNTSAGDTWRVNYANDGKLRIGDSDGDVEFAIDGAGNVTILGNLVTGGGGTCDPGPCDGTFIDYEVESIEEHAAYMWENKHLWGVGPTPDGQPINLSKKTTGILHELEKAHIYIEQLNSELATSRSEMQQALQAKEADLASMQERLERLERLIAAGMVD